MSGIYTRTGDNKTTAVYDPKLQNINRVDKDSIIVEAIGAVDELNSYLGVVRSLLKDKKISENVRFIQIKLFEVGAILSGASAEFSSESTKKIENVIDQIDDSLPPLKNFLLSEGSSAAVNLMYARALARRAERRVVSASRHIVVSKEVLSFLNRISDCLFVFFRKVNNDSGFTPDLWYKDKK